MGEYFYAPSAGWGMMSFIHGASCALGWERYILDWTPEIRANGIPSDISAYANTNEDGYIFTLRDYITTGDAIRIRIPTRDSIYQYLWLENHQCKSVFDKNVHDSKFCEQPIEESKKGLVAYVEAYSHVKDTNWIDLFYHGNGVRWLHRGGNHDFSFDPTPNNYTSLCGGQGYHFHTKQPNPIGGQNVGEYIRHDFNNDGHIDYEGGAEHSENNSAKNEFNDVVQLDDRPETPQFITGSQMYFQRGDKVGISTNPCVMNIPKYNSSTYKMEDFYLNGISFEILEWNNNGDMRVRIKTDDVSVNKDTRWTGASIALTDITHDGRPDVDVEPSVCVTIDKSGTPNRHKNPANPNQTSSVVSDFITPTTLTCREGSYFRQKNSSTIVVQKQSTLVLEAGSVYEIDDNALLDIKESGTLHVKSGATLRIYGTGRIDIQNGGYICVEDGANILLSDSLSSINLHNGYLTGVNPNGSAEAGNCTSSDLTDYALTTPSNGMVREYTDDNYIQNITYRHTAYETGTTVTAGERVTTAKPYGKVIVENGANVIWDGDGDVRLEPGVEVKYGGRLEIR